jgi:hypothetical protein
MKALIIKTKTDIDVIIEDGGYAFCYEADNKIKVDLYQAKIYSKVPEEFESLYLDNNYYKDFEINTPLELILQDILDWLVVDSQEWEKIIVESKSNEETYDLINEFLKLK